MATIKDVAKHAQVSTSTVSHVLNKTRYVSEEVTLKVQTAVKELNYAPSALARSLKLKHTRTFGMLVTTSINPFFAEVVKGVERRCYEEGYNLLLCNTEGDFDRLRFNIDMLLQKRVDGLLLMSDELVNQNIDIFERHAAVPTVVMDNGDTDFPSDKIQDNSYLGGYIATQYLIKNGHTKVGCIRGPINKPTAIKRYAGFEKAMLEAGLDINPDWVEVSNFECEDGANAFKKLHNKGNLPTALFVCNDMMAMGVINSATSLGMNIPENLSLVGYDDIKIARYMTPSLTTIHQSKFSLGQKAFDTLLEKIQTKRDNDLEIQLEPTLIERASVKKI